MASVRLQILALVASLARNEFLQTHPTEEAMDTDTASIHAPIHAPTHLTGDCSLVNIPTESDPTFSLIESTKYCVIETTSFYPPTNENYISIRLRAKSYHLILSIWVLKAYEQKAIEFFNDFKKNPFEIPNSDPFPFYYKPQRENFYQRWSGLYALFYLLHEKLRKSTENYNSKILYIDDFHGIRRGQSYKVVMTDPFIHTKNKYYLVSDTLGKYEVKLTPVESIDVLPIINIPENMPPGDYLLMKNDSERGLYISVN